MMCSSTQAQVAATHSLSVSQIRATSSKHSRRYAFSVAQERPAPLLGHSSVSCCLLKSGNEVICGRRDARHCCGRRCVQQVQQEQQRQREQQRPKNSGGMGVPA